VGNVYVGSVVTTQNPGAGQVQSKSVQALDVYGNITQSQLFAYGNLSAPARTYNYTYLTDGNYTSRYIRNRVTQVTVTDADGTTVLSTTGYDGYNVGPMWAVLKDRPGLTMHDASYGTSLVYRGNATSMVSLGDAKYVGYEISGVAYQWRDGAGHTYTTDPASTTNYPLPGVLTLGGNANLATSITYAGSFAVTSVSGPTGRRRRPRTTPTGYRRRARFRTGRRPPRWTLPLTALPLSPNLPDEVAGH